ncbi:hypothetical protein V7O66_03570 [Methanolobus sp. ZRKC3]|uniref:hypothetical protein n=1 Tax=Methanolobus sp. ZRKC3 TaxID=3125786 RepID=UPI00324DF616
MDAPVQKKRGKGVWGRGEKAFTKVLLFKKKGVRGFGGEGKGLLKGFQDYFYC